MPGWPSTSLIRRRWFSTLLRLACRSALEERLEVTVDGASFRSKSLAFDHGSVAHLVRSPAGDLQIAYAAVVDRSTPVEAAVDAALTHEQLIYLLRAATAHPTC